ncbi:MAG: DUF190 domain-containing protein [Peptococcaceae bacterium]|nr:DUF190 domain-containing protein [Peptococcaceae bacterium]
MVKISGKAKLLQIYIGESDRYKGKPLYRAIVNLAKKEGLAGATVTRAILGFGANSRIHSANILRLSEDLPVMISIVDSEEYINKILPKLDEMVPEGLITVQDVDIIKYRPNPQSEKQ